MKKAMRQDCRRFCRAGEGPACSEASRCP
jgi:hypothetical protein